MNGTTNDESSATGRFARMPATRIELAAGPQFVAPTRAGEAVAYSIREATLELDVPKSGGFFERVTADERFARIRVQALDQGGRNGGSIDQEPFELVHRLPAGAKTLTVTVGADGRKPAAITLERRP